MSGVSLSSASTCGIAQNESLSHCAFGLEQVGAVDPDRIQTLMVHTISLLDIWAESLELALELVVRYILTGDTVVLGLGMFVRVVLDVDDQAFAAGCRLPA